MSTTLTLQLSEKTVKKLRALAMLSGSTVDQLERDFAEYFDSMLSENIAHLLSQMDGGTASIPERNPGATHLTATPEIDDVRHEEESEGKDFNAHALSEDELPAEVKSSAEQVEEGGFPLPPPLPAADAEDFLDGFFGATPGGSGNKTSSARRTFDPRAPKARVSEYTGDESGPVS